MCCATPCGDLNPFIGLFLEQFLSGQLYGLGISSPLRVVIRYCVFPFMLIGVCFNCDFLFVSLRVVGLDVVISVSL